MSSSAEVGREVGKDNLLLMSWSHYDKTVTSAFKKYLSSKVRFYIFIYYFVLNVCLPNF